MDGDGRPGADQPAQLDGLPSGHAVAHRPGDREPHAAQVQQGGADLEAVGEAVSRLSPWWSWLSRTTSIGPRSAAATAGPVSLWELNASWEFMLHVGVGDALTDLATV